MSVLIPLVLGGTAGGGVLVALRATRPAHLAGALGRLGKHDGTAEGSVLRDRNRMWVVAARHVARRTPSRLMVDLALLGRDPLVHAADRMRGALVALVGAAVLVMLLAPEGGTANTGTLLLVALAFIATGWHLPTRRVYIRARRERSDAVAALSSYLDLVTVLLAGGAGLETALHGAAQAGGGWMFGQFRNLLVRARTTRTSVWDECAALGRSTGIPQLTELGASVQLAGQHGARVADSLASRAVALRAQVLAGIEADAAAATERMGLPSVLLFGGFLFLLGYPAAQIILASA